MIQSTNQATRRHIDDVQGGQQRHQRPKRIRIEEQTAALGLANLAGQETPQISDPSTLYKIQNGPFAKGEQLNEDGSRFKGIFKSGVQFFGTITYLDGTFYKGQVQNGMPHGKGILCDLDKTIIKKGIFKNGVIKGNEPMNAIVPAKVVPLPTAKKQMGQIPVTQPKQSQTPSNNEVILNEDQVLKEKRTGTLKMKYPNGNIYEGEVKDGKSHGKGKFYHPNGNIFYEGEVKEGKANGKGKFYRPDGKLAYEGEFKDGKSHGKGKFYHPNGNIFYEGEVKDGKSHGKGKLYLPNGNIFYEGEVKEGKANGKGKFYRPDGKLAYEGEVKDGNPDGQGTKYDETGKVIQKGLFENRVFKGNVPLNANVPGKIVPLPSAKKQMGPMPVTQPKQSQIPSNNEVILNADQVLRENRTGTFKIIYSGGIYEGEVKDGLPNGQGKTYLPDGTLVYEGEFKDGRWNGQGKFYLPNGKLVYKGEFKDGKANGQGTSYDETGKVIQKGLFENGVFKG